MSTFRKFLPAAAIKDIEDRLRAKGARAAATPTESRELVNSWLAWQKRVASLLTAVGRLGQCSTCGATVYWCKGGNSGKWLPFRPNGTAHLAECPQADELPQTRAVANAAMAAYQRARAEPVGEVEGQAELDYRARAAGEGA